MTKLDLRQLCMKRRFFVWWNCVEMEEKNIFMFLLHAIKPGNVLRLVVFLLSRWNRINIIFSLFKHIHHIDSSLERAMKIMLLNIIKLSLPSNVHASKKALKNILLAFKSNCIKRYRLIFNDVINEFNYEEDLRNTNKDTLSGTWKKTGYFWEFVL